MLLVALWAGAYLTWPMAGDHGQLALIGDVIRDGGLPYRDAWTMKGPLALYAFAGIQLLFGRAMWGVRAFELLVLAAGGWAVFLGARRFTGSRAALWTAAGFVLSYASLRYQNIAQPDGWAGVLLALAFLPLLGRTERPSAGLRVLGGALVGCATLIKPLYGIFLLVPALDAFIAPPPRWRRLLAAGGLTGVGFLLPIAITAAWFAAHGALRELIEVDLLYASGVYTPQFDAGLQHRLYGLLQLLLTKNPPTVASAVAGDTSSGAWIVVPP